MSTLSAKDFVWAVEHGLLPAAVNMTIGNVLVSNLDVDAHDLRLRRFHELPKARLVLTLGDAANIAARLTPDEPPPRHASVAVPWPAGRPDPCIEVQLTEVDLSGGVREAAAQLATVERLATDGLARARRRQQRRAQRIAERLARSWGASASAARMSPTHSVGSCSPFSSLAQTPVAARGLSPATVRTFERPPALQVVNEQAPPPNLPSPSCERSPSTTLMPAFTPLADQTPSAVLDPGPASVEQPTMPLDFVEAAEAAAAALEDAEASAASLGLRASFTLPLLAIAQRALDRAALGRDVCRGKWNVPVEARDWWAPLCKVDVSLCLCPHAAPESLVFTVPVDVSDHMRRWLDVAERAIRDAAIQNPADPTTATTGDSLPLHQLAFDDDAIERAGDALATVEVDATLAVPVPLRGAWRPCVVNCNVELRMGAPLQRVTLGTEASTQGRAVVTAREAARLKHRSPAAARTADDEGAVATEATLSVAAKVHLARAVDAAVEHAAETWEAAMRPILVRLDQLGARVTRLEGAVNSQRDARVRVAQRFAAALERTGERHLTPPRMRAAPL